MTQWKYETLRPPRGATHKEISDPKAQLNELGADDWELVSTLDYVGGGTKFLVFKRPADGDETENETGTETEGSADADGTSADETGADERADTGEAGGDEAA